MSEPAEVASENRGGRVREESAEEKAARHGPGSQALLALAVLGIVYGDLGTSTIYSLHTVFTGTGRPLPANPTTVLGVVSLVFWTLIIVVSLKYMIFVLRDDNRGEGGVFALIALLRPWRNLRRPSRRVLILTGLAGAAMLYAGVMITPAISILSAVEGLEVASPSIGPLVIPITIAIIVLLFATERFGTARVGVAFGPVMLLWFVAIAALGVYGIAQDPGVLVAVNPVYAASFFVHDGLTAFLILFGVFLVTTGAEALYADIGHFGRRWIRRIWFAFVLPALMLSYFGQGGMLLRHPSAISHPFFHLIPQAVLYPTVVLAMLATIIASQAAITGSFSMTRAAGRLGMMPPPRTVHTSDESSGQVYVPVVNWMLMVAAIVLVLLFQSSDKLASTYGISVNTAMLVTTILAFFVAREHGRWRTWQAALFLVGFGTVDAIFLASNLLRIPYGGWFPVAVAVVLFAVMSTWRRGEELLTRRTRKDARSVADVLGELDDGAVARVPGTAVFVTSWLHGTPPSLTHHIRRNHALQEKVVLLSVLTEDVPHTRAAERAEFDDLSHGFCRVTLHYGYMQKVNVPSDLGPCGKKHSAFDLNDATYYVEHDTPLTGRGRLNKMAAWRDRLFGLLKRNSVDPTTQYQLPSDRVIDMGVRIRL